MGQTRMRGFQLFLAVTVVASLVTIALLLVGLLTVGDRQILSKPDQVQAISGILALILGTAAAFAGAIATIRVADLGLMISERQEKVDTVGFLEARLSRSAEIYSRVLLEIGNLYAAGIVVDARVPHIDTRRLKQDGEALRRTLDAEAPESLLAEFDYLHDTLGNLIASLRDLAQDDFSIFCFDQASRSRTGKLDLISTELTRMGMPAKEVTVSLTNLADIIALFEIARRKLRGGSLGLVVQARLFANSSDIDLFEMSYDNRAVRSFFFLGNLVFSRSDRLPDGRVFIASYGAAMIHDLVAAIPDGKVIREALQHRYPDFSVSLPYLKAEFEPDNILSTNVSTTIQDIERIGNLYLLVSKEAVRES